MVTAMTTQDEKLTEALKLALRLSTQIKLMERELKTKGLKFVYHTKPNTKYVRPELVADLEELT